MNKLAVIGLGYVGLPLAIEFAKKYQVKGYDINLKRINELNSHYDSTNELSKKDLRYLKLISFTSKINELADSNIFIITVPTPIYKSKKPDLRLLKQACNNIGKLLKKNDIVIIESTVYPGTTEEFCVPILEKKSNLKYNKDFFCGYSPERINPGDKKHKITDIVKIISGSNKKTTRIMDNLYSKVIKVGTYKVSSIRIAEAAKIIENCQRDLNIAFVNELSIIFDKLNLDYLEILKAAATKWNFLNFKPGLVGGHCIGVDPYYLTFKSKKHGYNPKVISSGRLINDYMPKFIVKKLIKYLKKNKIKFKNYKILIMGMSFKENCKDVRNSKIYNLYLELLKNNFFVDIYDPIADAENSLKYYDLKLIKKPKNKFYDIIIIAVSHNFFSKIGINKIKNFGKNKKIIFDLKNMFNNQHVDIRL